MNSNFRVATAGLAGLQGLRWNGFLAVIPTPYNTYVQIPRPSFVVSAITTNVGFSAGGAAKNSITSVTLTVAATSNNGFVPSWLFPGAAVNINITLNGNNYAWGVSVKDVAANGTTFTVTDNERRLSNISVTLAAQALDAVGGAVVNTITLNTQCQKVMLQLPAAATQNVTVAPAADMNPTPLAGYSVTLTPGGAEYEITAPTGSKFDICDWWFKAATALTQTLSIRFL